MYFYIFSEQNIGKCKITIFYCFGMNISYISPIYRSEPEKNVILQPIEINVET